MERIFYLHSIRKGLEIFGSHDRSDLYKLTIVGAQVENVIEQPVTYIGLKKLERVDRGQNPFRMTLDFQSLGSTKTYFAVLYLFQRVRFRLGEIYEKVFETLR